MNRIRTSVGFVLAAAALFVVGAVVEIALVPLVAPVKLTRAANPRNPCSPRGSKAANPCNPCSPRGSKAANPCNPCNPCAAKTENSCNPCNPCAAKGGNPCNPCAAGNKSAKPTGGGKKITWGQDYKSYEKTTGFVPSASHGNRLVVTYVSPNGAAEKYRRNAKLVRQKKTGGFTKFPVGTIIAKDSFIKTKSGKPGNRGPIFFMRKEKPGYDPSGGDWSYAFTRPNFSLIGEGKAGKVAFCKACHVAVKNRDYVYAVDR